MLAEHIRIQPPSYTMDEYFGLLESSDRRWEYWDGELVCMAGGSPEHAKICTRTSNALYNRIADRGCEVFGSDMPIKTPSLPPFRFPDISVVCSDPIFEQVNRFKALANPIVLIEVLSTSTEHLDRESKRLAYQALSSVQEYLLIAQSIPHVTHYVRKGKRWQRFEYSDMDAVIQLSSIACELPLREIYRGIKFQ